MPVVLFLCTFARKTIMRFLHTIPIFRSVLLLAFVWVWSGFVESSPSAHSAIPHGLVSPIPSAEPCRQILAAPSDAAFSWSFLFNEEETEEESEQDDHEPGAFWLLDHALHCAAFCLGGHEPFPDAYVPKPLTGASIALFVWHHAWRSSIA